MGFGVVGIKTLTKASFVLEDISVLLSFVAKPTAHVPFLGYSTKTTDFFELSFLVKVSVICPIAEYIVLKIGIRLNKSSTNCKNFLPKNERDKPPTKVIKIIVKIISSPGIEKCRYVFGLIFSGINFEDMPIKNFVKYKVKPIGINTTTPVKK